MSSYINSETVDTTNKITNDIVTELMETQEDMPEIEATNYETTSDKTNEVDTNKSPIPVITKGQVLQRQQFFESLAQNSLLESIAKNVISNAVTEDTTEVITKDFAEDTTYDIAEDTSSVGSWNSMSVFPESMKQQIIEDVFAREQKAKNIIYDTTESNIPFIKRDSIRENMNETKRKIAENVSQICELGVKVPSL